MPASQGFWKDFLLWERASHDCIDFKKVYVDMTGDIVSALMLSQIVFWFLPNKTGAPKTRIVHDGYTWIARGNDDWWDECRVKRNQAVRVLNDLKELGLIETRLYKFGGTPMVHIRICEDRFEELWNTHVQQNYSENGDSIYLESVNPLSDPEHPDLLNTSNSYRTETYTENYTEREERARERQKSGGIKGTPEQKNSLITQPIPENNVVDNASSKFYMSLARRRKVTHSDNRNLKQWSEQFEQFCKKENIPLPEFLEVLDWWSDHAGDDFVPTKGIASATGFISRYGDVLEAMRRSERDNKKPEVREDSPPAPRMTRKIIGTFAPGEYDRLFEQI